MASSQDAGPWSSTDRFQNGLSVFWRQVPDREDYEVQVKIVPSASYMWFCNFFPEGHRLAMKMDKIIVKWEDVELIIREAREYSPAREST